MRLKRLRGLILITDADLTLYGFRLSAEKHPTFIEKACLVFVRLRRSRTSQVVCVFYKRGIPSGFIFLMLD